jgi:MFS transporter, UMF1 family
MTDPIRPARGGLLQTLGLHRPELRAWAMYDWALSAVQTTVMVAVFPIFYIQVAGAGHPAVEANQQWATSNAIATFIVAVLSPLLGAVADYAAAKKKLLLGSMVIGVVACAGMFLIGRGDLMLASMLFILAAIGAAASSVFYEALLPHIAGDHEVDRVSSAGYAIGYLGGGVLLAINLAMILKPALFGIPTADPTLPTRLAMVSVAVWWLVFSIPLFRRVSEPPTTREADETERVNVARAAFTRLGETFRELRGYKQAFLMLTAFLIYNDGVSTIQKMATAYGTELGIDRGALISVLFGMLAGKIGAKRSIFFGLLVYCGISVLGYYMQTATHFFLLAGLVGMVQGGTQALSRSLFATLIPRHKSGEFFGFYSVFNKFAGIFGPLLFAGTIGATGSSRNAILSVILFFFVGAFILMFVNVEEGERVARAAERDLHVAPAA